MNDPITDWDAAFRSGGARGALDRVRADLVAADEKLFEKLLKTLELWMILLGMKGAVRDVFVVMQGEVRHADLAVEIAAPELTAWRKTADQLRAVIGELQVQVQDGVGLRQELDRLLEEATRLRTRQDALLAVLAAVCEHPKGQIP